MKGPAHKNLYGKLGVKGQWYFVSLLTKKDEKGNNFSYFSMKEWKQ